jgi:hypothetical protein
MPSSFSLPLLTRPRINIQPQHIRIQENLIPAVLQDSRDILRVLKLPQINVTSALLDGLTNQLCGTSLTLGADNSGLLFLAGFVDHEGGALGFLLGDLLGFDGGGEFGGEGEVLGGLLVWLYSEKDLSWTYCDGHIVQKDVESCSTLDEVFPDHPTDVLTLCDQLTGVELCNNTLEDLVDDGWQYTLVVICAKGSVYLR